MKYITVPGFVDIFNLTGDRVKDEKGADATMTFAQFVLGRLADPKFGKSMAAVMTAFEIKKQVDAPEDGVVALENEHHKALLDAVESPESAYHPAFAQNLVPFMLAVKNATDKKPEKN